MKKLLLLITILAIGGTGWYVYNKNREVPVQNSQQNQPIEHSQSNGYEGWGEYCDDSVKACIKYPSDWIKSEYGGLQNTSCTQYVSLTGSTIKDAGKARAYIASVDNLEDPDLDLKILGIIVDTRPSYSVYDSSYVKANNIESHKSYEIDYINHRFDGKNGEVGLDGTPCADGYKLISTFEQAKSWFSSNDGQIVFRVIRSFFYK